MALEDKLKEDLSEAETQEAVNEIKESANDMGFEDVAKLAEKKLKAISAKVEQAETTSPATIEGAKNLGAVNPEVEIKERTKEVDQKIDEVKTDAETKIAEVQGEAPAPETETPKSTEAPVAETSNTSETQDSPEVNTNFSHEKYIENTQKYELLRKANDSFKKAVEGGDLDEAMRQMASSEELKEGLGKNYYDGVSYVYRENLARNLLAAKRYDEAVMVAGKSGADSHIAEYVKNSIDSDKEQEAFAGTFAEESSQLETIKASAESATTLEDLGASLKLAQALQDRTYAKFQEIRAGKGLGGAVPLDEYPDKGLGGGVTLEYPDNRTLTHLAEASKFGEMEKLVANIRGKMSGEAEKAGEAMLTQLNADFDAFTNNVTETLVSVPEVGSLEGLGLKELRSKLSELKTYQQKLDTIANPSVGDLLHTIEERQYQFEDKMRFLEAEGVRVRFNIGDHGRRGGVSDFWQRIEKDGSQKKAVDAIIDLREKAPTLVAPKMEVVQQAIDKLFVGYEAEIDEIATEYQKGKEDIEAQEKGINAQISESEASKGMFNKGKVEAQITELRKGLGKLEVLKNETKTKLDALWKEMENLNSDTNKVYDDKFNALFGKNVQVQNNIMKG